MKEFKWVVIALALVMTIVSPGRKAEAKEEQVIKMDEIVVTATKIERKVTEVPASITTLTSEDIDTSAKTTLDQLFRYTPSLQIIRGEGMGTIHNFMSIRGMGGKRNLIYVDGVSMVESYRGTTNLSLLPTENVERVEILRGPSSALYGGRAMGGVINIFTKPPEKGWHISFQPKYGDYDYEHYPFHISYGADKFGISLNYEHKSIDNYWTRDKIVGRDYDYQTGTYTYYDTDEEQGHKDWEHWNRDYEEDSFRGKLYLNPWDNTNLTLSFGYMENETGSAYTNRYENVGGESNVEKYLEKSKIYVGLSGETKLEGNTNLSYRATYHNPETDSHGENMDLTVSLADQTLSGSIWHPKPTFYRSSGENGSRDYELEVMLSKPLLKSHLVTVGTEYIRNEIYEDIEDKGTGRDLTNDMDENLDVYAVYLQDEWRIIDSLLLTVGLRADFYSDFDDEFSPKVGLLYDLTEKTQLFGSFATAYNPPPYYQVYCPDWNMTAYIIRVKNPDLESEESMTYELGARHKFSDNFRVGVTGFWTEADDLIESVSEKRQVGQSTPFPANKKCYMTYEHNENIDEARMRGIETELELKLGKSHKFFANYTYLDTENKDTGDRLERRPKHMANLGYFFKREISNDLSFWSSIKGRYVGKRWLKEWGTSNKLWVNKGGKYIADLSLGLDILKHGQIFFNVTNLFDEDYKEFTYSRYEPGRLVWGGVNLYF